MRPGPWELDPGSCSWGAVGVNMRERENNGDLWTGDGSE